MGESVDLDRLKVVSLFTGCGGMDLGVLGGFEYLGREYPRNPVEIVYAIDNDRHACAIYNANFEQKCNNVDVRKVEASEIPAHHILTGGFPCQSFSIVAQNPPRLGYRDEKGQLFFEMCRILREKKPMCFVAENVKGILSANKGQAFPVIIRNFEDASYHVTHGVLDSSDFGIPQKRERVFIVGFRNPDFLKRFEFPNPIARDSKVPLSRVVTPENEVHKKYYFSERAVKGMERVKAKMNKGRVQNLNEPCNTIGAHLAKVSLNSTDPVLKVDGRYRRFTPREAARIQSFPEDFILIGPDSWRYRTIGNAVPPVLMWHITREIVRAIKNANETYVKNTLLQYT